MRPSLNSSLGCSFNITGHRPFSSREACVLVDSCPEPGQPIQVMAPGAALRYVVLSGVQISTSGAVTFSKVAGMIPTIE